MFAAIAVISIVASVSMVVVLSLIPFIFLAADVIHLVYDAKYMVLLVVDVNVFFLLFSITSD